jgi:hypothetical protein
MGSQENKTKVREMAATQGNGHQRGHRGGTAKAVQVIFPGAALAADPNHQ